MSFITPIKAGLGQWLAGFHAQVVGDTQFTAEFAGRALSKSIAFAPDRMIDQAEDMLSAWRKNDTSGQAKGTPLLPVMLVAVSKDYLPAPPDYMRPVANPIDVMIPGDAKERVFKMRVAGADVRAQIVIFAPDGDTARSLGMQLALYAQEVQNRYLYATYPLVGLNEKWAGELELPDFQAISTPTDVKNLTILAVDVQIRVTIPMLMRPVAAPGQSDGKGTGTEADPDGYLVVVEAQGANREPESDNPISAWSVT